MSLTDLLYKIDNSRVFLCLLSKGAKDDAKVAIELGLAIQRDLPIGLIVLDGVAGCLMIVTEPKDFGAQGYVQALGTCTERGGQAYYRAKWSEMEYVGVAAWVVP